MNEDLRALQAVAIFLLWLGLVLLILTLGALWGVGVYHLVRGLA